MKKIGLVVLVAVVGMVAWHMVLANRMNRNASMLKDLSDAQGNELAMQMKINPVTNVVTVYMRMAPSSDDAWGSLGTTMAEGLLTTIGPQAMERQLAILSREKIDVYAMIIPYRVQILTGADAFEQGRP